MKRLITILLFLSMLMLASCGGDGEIVPDATDTAETTTIDVTTNATDETTDANTDSVINNVTVEPYHLTDISDRYIVSIMTSPVNTSNPVNITNAINNHIKNQIAFAYYPLEEFELKRETELSDEIPIRIDSGEYTEYILKLEGETVYNGDDHISIVYKGIYNNKTAAHPTNLCFSVNLNDKAERVYFKDIYNVSDELYEVFASYAQTKVDEDLADYGLSVKDILCTKDSFLAGIENESTVNFYMTEDSVGFIYSVPHAVGDYLTVEIPLTELEQFK